MLRHPEPDALDSYVRGLSTGDAGLLLHVLRCDDCAAYVLDALATPEQRVGLRALRRDLAEIDYSSLWQRIEERSEQAMALLRQERSEAEPLLSELLQRPQEDRLRRIQKQPRFRSWTLADLLLAEGRAHPERREDLARCVIAMAEAGLDRHTERVVSDLVAAASCELAEALRARGDLPGAETAFETAAQHLASSLDSHERANFCHLLAALRRDQGRLDEALALLDRAADLLEETGHHQARAAARIEFGLLALEAGEPERALEALNDALALGRNLSLRLAGRAVKGVALALACEGRFDDALSAMAGARQTYGWPPESPEALHLQVVEGRLALEADRGEKARHLLTAAFHGLAQLGEPAEACAAAVHLLRALLLDRRPRKELRQVSHQIEPLLASPKIDEQARQKLEDLIQVLTGSSPVKAQTLRDLAGHLERTSERSAGGSA